MVGTASAAWGKMQIQKKKWAECKFILNECKIMKPDLGRLNSPIANQSFSIFCAIFFFFFSPLGTFLATRHQDGLCEAALGYGFHRGPLRDDSHRVGVPKGSNRIVPEEEPGSEGGLPLHTAEDGDVLQSESHFALAAASKKFVEINVAVSLFFFLFFLS